LGGLYVCAGGLDIESLTKTQMVYSVSYLYLGGLGTLIGGSKPPKSPRGDGTATGVLRNLYSVETVPPCKKVWEPLVYVKKAEKIVKVVMRRVENKHRNQNP